jgi:hypothetical protein
MALLATVAPSSAKSVPASFFGIVPQATPTEADLDRMDGFVGTLRIPVSWPQFEPQPGAYAFGILDEQVLAAADHGIGVLPFVGGTPAWLSPDPAHVPVASLRARRAWGAFLRRLVARYGPGGSIWIDQRRPLPIRRWQIWNEPNFPLFWHKPSPRRYARLLSVAAGAIRKVDSKARVVLAGLAPVENGPLPWVYLRRLYRVPGVKQDFDVVAVHPYATSVSGMSSQIEAARAVMAEAGDRRSPLLVSEVGVASWGSVASPFIKGRAGQAEFVRRAFARMVEKRRAWHLAGTDWFTWRDKALFDAYCSFCQGAGLLDLSGEAKPAWWAFRRTVRAAVVR